MAIARALGNATAVRATSRRCMRDKTPSAALAKPVHQPISRLAPLIRAPRYNAERIAATCNRANPLSPTRCRCPRDSHGEGIRPPAGRVQRDRKGFRRVSAVLATLLASGAREITATARLTLVRSSLVETCDKRRARLPILPRTSQNEPISRAPPSNPICGTRSPRRSGRPARLTAVIAGLRNFKKASETPTK